MQKKDMEKIYGMHYRELYLYAHTLCRNEEQAKDLTSETFYRAFVSFDMKEEKLKYWLFRVLKNLYIDEKRKKPGGAYRKYRSSCGRVSIDTASKDRAANGSL